MSQNFPASVVVVKEVTPHCVIDNQGQVVFLRRVNGEEKLVVCKTIYNAISQCFHILNRLLGEAIVFYRGQPTIFGQGEIGQLQEISRTLQEVISSITSCKIIPELEVFIAQRRFVQLVAQLGLVRNQHKVKLKGQLDHLPSITDKDGRRQAGTAVASSESLTIALQRFEEVDSIIRGTWIQAKKLIGLAVAAESRIEKVFGKLGNFQAQVDVIILEIEAAQRATGEAIPADGLEKLGTIAKKVAGEGSNQIVNALKGIAPVEPYKSRLEHRDVVCLENLPKYLDKWVGGKVKKIYTFQRAFGRARSKLARLARTSEASADGQMLAKQYTTRIG